MAWDTIRTIDVDVDFMLFGSSPVSFETSALFALQSQQGISNQQTKSKPLSLCLSDMVSLFNIHGLFFLDCSITLILVKKQPPDCNNSACSIVENAALEVKLHINLSLQRW